MENLEVKEILKNESNSQEEVVVSMEETVSKEENGDGRENFRSNGGRNNAGFFKKPFKKRVDFKRFDRNVDDIATELVSLRAVSKTRAGGRQRSFSVLMLAGNEKGLIGCGTGKAGDVVDAIKKAEKKAKKNLIKVALKNNSITHNVYSYFCGVSVIMKRVPEGTGLKAGGVARKVLKLAGIKDISCKSIGNAASNHNVVYAVLEALKQTMQVKQIAKSLNKNVKEVLERRM